MNNTLVENSSESLKAQFYTHIYGKSNNAIVSNEVAEVVDIAEDMKKKLIDLISKIDNYNILICDKGTKNLLKLFNALEELQKMFVEYGDLPF